MSQQKHALFFSFLAFVRFLVCSSAHAAPPPKSVMMPGIKQSQLPAKQKALALFTELNCVACHATQSPMASNSKKSPRLAAIGARANPYYLERFILAPHATKPGTSMPSMLSQLKTAEQKEVARSITHYLLSLSKSRPFDLTAPDMVAAELGKDLFHSAGCVACHSPRQRSRHRIAGGDFRPAR